MVEITVSSIKYRTIYNEELVRFVGFCADGYASMHRAYGVGTGKISAG